ncbi:MAG: 16S rRNA (uracil(1498)-N(3))-methyltransferase [Burkholderiales bacterium]|nr:16S rRNA (uracil(1498)-N(3))-methyltransferase [Burkholderiales bacterium]
MLPPGDSAAAPRFHCPEGLAVGATIALPDRAAQHVRVLRLAPGDAVTLFSGDGAEYAAEVLEIGRRAVSVLVRSRRETSRESPLAIRLAQGLSGGDRMDLVIQKATELGVTAVQPVLTARSIVRLSSERQERREAHWQNVAIAACEQCGRNVVPEVLPLVPLADFLAQPRSALALVLSPAGSASLRAIAPAADVEILIGPEGGLTAAEREAAVAVGFTAVRLGPRILRTETAPLAAIAALQSMWGDG